MTSQTFEPTGVITDDSGVEEYIDTYSFGGTKKFEFNNGKQWIEFKQMNEGQKANYERLTNRDLTVNRKTEEARIKMDVAGDRHTLIMLSVVGWHIFTRGVNGWDSVSFNKTMLENWLQVAPPEIVSDLEDAIREANPWMGTEDLTVEQIDEQIADLQKERDKLVAREAAKLG